MSQPATINRLWSLIRQLQGALGGNRVVRGVFDSASGTAAVLEGEGWTVARVASPGEWLVTFDPPFSDVPAVVSSARSASFRLAQLGAEATASTATIHCYNSSAAKADANSIHFVAVGPR